MFVPALGLPRLVFHCRQCLAALTEPVVPLTDPSRLSEADGTHYVPAGTTTPATGEDGFGTGEWVVHLADAARCDYHRDRRRLNGCCGHDGLDGPNRTCGKRHEVGTEHSDCWQVHGVGFAPTHVLISDGDGPPFDVNLGIDPDWATHPTVRAIAEGIALTGDTGGLPVLADALEEAGFTGTDVLNHLRESMPHRGGCWFVYRILTVG